MYEKYRTKIEAGHIFYYLRKDNINLPEIDIDNKTYKRIDDFGIVPITFIKGYYPKAHEHFMKHLNKDIVNHNQIKHIPFRGNIIKLAESTGIPWLLYADIICPNYFIAEDLETLGLDYNISKFKVSELFYMENYVEHYIDFIYDLETKNIKPINFIIKNVGKEYEFLYDVLYDAIEIVFWHGSYRGIKNLQFAIESIIQKEIIEKIPEIAQLYWKQSGFSAENTEFIKILKELEEHENKAIEKEKIMQARTRRKITKRA